MTRVKKLFVSGVLLLAFSYGSACAQTTQEEIGTVREIYNGALYPGRGLNQRMDKKLAGAA